MPTSTLRAITERMLDLLSDDDRRAIEIHLAVARLSPERRSRLLDRFEGSFEAFADDMQAFIQAATSVSPGSHEDVLPALGARGPDGVNTAASSTSCSSPRSLTAEMRLGWK